MSELISCSASARAECDLMVAACVVQQHRIHQALCFSETQSVSFAVLNASEGSASRCQHQVNSNMRDLLEGAEVGGACVDVEGRVCLLRPPQLW